MVRTLIRNATIFDATGAEPFKGDLLIDGNRIAAVGPAAAGAPADSEIDATGLFCMPGMTEGHTHLSFEGVWATENLITPTPEEQVFTAARGAKALIEMGFTSAYGASEAKLRLAVAVRNEVNAGRLPGPRIRAGGLEISVTGAMGDESMIHNPRVGPSTICDGPEEVRKAVQSDELKAVWASQGAEFPPLSQQQFAQFVGGEVKRWSNVVKVSGARID